MAARTCLQGVVGELEQQKAAAEQRADEEEEVKAWILVSGAMACLVGCSATLRRS